METFDKKLLLHIKGMTCINCQNKIEKELYRTEGVIRARVSFNHGTADIVYNERKVSPEEIISVIESLDYEVLREKEEQKSDILRAVCMLVIIVAVYVMLQSMDLLNLLVPSQLADSKMGYGMLFVIGLLTSVHCIAMCGGINLSQCIPQVAPVRRTEEKSVEDRGEQNVFRPALAYNMGRVLSYTVIGFVLGMIGFLIGGGTEVGLSVFLQGILKIIAGLFMVIMGINMLELFPWLRKFMIRVPAPVACKIGEKKLKSSRPFIVGILNGFMPCGPLQSMWIVALATGNPVAGALSMFLFSLGTVPLMLGFGSIVSILGKKFTDKVMTVGAVLVVVLGLAMLSQGGSLSGWLPSDLLFLFIIAFCIAGVLLSIPLPKPQWKNIVRIASLAIIVGSYVLWNLYGTKVGENRTADAQTEVVEGVQVVNSTLLSGSYPNITVQSGVPVKWVIEAPEGSINGCNYKMIIQDYDIEYTFKEGENVIEFIPTGSGTVRYSCWMGMIRGNIFVTNHSKETAGEEEEKNHGK